LTRDEVINKRTAEAGQLYRGTMAKAYAGTCSPRSAIKAQCLICVGYDRGAITACTGYSCPLWAYRPYQIEGGSDSRNDASAPGGGGES
jgi:hypothetical protein